MRTHAAEPGVSPDIGVNVGLLVAASMARETFEPSLSARSPVDQGVVTALSTGLHYLVTLGTQDAIQAVAAEIARKYPARGPQDALARQRAVTFVADLAVVPVGLALRRAVPTDARRGDGAWRDSTGGMAACSDRLWWRATDRQQGVDRDS